MKQITLLQHTVSEIKTSYIISTKKLFKLKLCLWVIHIMFQLQKSRVMQNGTSVKKMVLRSKKFWPAIYV